MLFGLTGPPTRLRLGCLPTDLCLVRRVTCQWSWSTKHIGQSSNVIWIWTHLKLKGSCNYKSWRSWDLMPMRACASTKRKLRLSMISEFYTGSLLPGKKSFYLILVSNLCLVNSDLDGMVLWLVMFFLMVQSGLVMKEQEKHSWWIGSS